MGVTTTSWRKYYYLIVFHAVVLFGVFSFHSSRLIEHVGGIRSRIKYPTVDPKDIFLWYTRTPKTSSTVAGNLIAEAYSRYSVPFLNMETDIETGVAGTYASIDHMEFSVERLEKISRTVRKPVLLVVSIREGRDWMISFTVRAQQYTGMKNLTGVDPCKRTKLNPTSMVTNYKRNLPEQNATNPNLLEHTPWAVIRHTDVVDDTCHLLSRLGMKCNRNLRIGQMSRAKIGTDKCDFSIDEQAVERINSLNRAIWNQGTWYLHKRNQKISDCGESCKLH